jgi:hypothetical protein
MPIDGISLNDITIQARRDAEFHNCKNIKRQNVNIIVK